MRVAVRGGALGDVLLGIPAWRAVRDAPAGRREAAPGRDGDASPPAFVVAVPGPVAPLVRLALEDGRTPVAVVTLDDPAFRSLHGTGTPLPSPAVPDWSAVEVAVAWTRAHAEVGQRLAMAGVARVVAADPFPPAGARVHAADWLASTLAPAGIRVAAGWDRSPWLRVPAGTPPPAGPATAGGPAVVVHPGSGSPRKCWPPARWREIVDWLVGEGWRVTVLEGEADAGAVAAVVGEGGAPSAWSGRVEVARCLDLPRVAARLATAAVVVANDSGVAHVAAGLGAPVVAVFGPTDPVTWRPRGPRVATLGGTPGSAWPHAGGAPPDRVAWPDVAAVRAAIRWLAAT